MQLIGRWGGTLKFFPSDPDARIGIAEEIAEMAGDEEQVRWLVKRVPKIHDAWPGVREVRAVFCSKFKPKDGIDAYSQVYPDGIPSEKEEAPQLPAPKPRQIAASEPQTHHPSIAAHISDVARLKDLNRVLSGEKAKTIRDFPVVKLDPSKMVTAADIERAVEDLRKRKAEEEIGAAGEVQ